MTLVCSKIRTKTHRMTVEEFVEKLFEMAYVKPMPSCIHQIKGEVFLTDKAFSKLVAADDKVAPIFFPHLSETSSGVVGVLKSMEGTVFSIRTNAMQRSIHRDYEGLGDGDMELRLFA